MKLSNVAALAALIVLVATPAHAQRRGDRPMRPDRPGMRAPGMRGLNVESALRMREELKLTPAQVTQLQNLRRELVAQRQKESSDMIDLQSRIAAGDVERDEMRTYFEGRRDQMEATMKQRKEQFDKILTVEQRGELNRAQMNFRPAERPDGAGPRFREAPRRRWR